MKKISLNTICSFIFFDNYINNQIKYNAFSNIIYKDITILNIHIKDLQKDNNKYNIIEVNSQEYPIKKDIEIQIIENQILLAITLKKYFVLLAFLSK